MVTRKVSIREPFDANDGDTELFKCGCHFTLQRSRRLENRIKT
jgi:hypothetical protein